MASVKQRPCHLAQRHQLHHFVGVCWEQPGQRKCPRTLGGQFADTRGQRADSPPQMGLRTPMEAIVMLTQAGAGKPRTRARPQQCRLSWPPLLLTMLVELSPHPEPGKFFVPNHHSQGPKKKTKEERQSRWQVFSRCPPRQCARTTM